MPCPDCGCAAEMVYQGETTQMHNADCPTQRRQKLRLVKPSTPSEPPRAAEETTE